MGFASFALRMFAGLGTMVGLLVSIGGLAVMAGFDAGAGTGRFGEDGAGKPLMDDEDPPLWRLVSGSAVVCCSVAAGFVVVVVVASPAAGGLRRNAGLAGGGGLGPEGFVTWSLAAGSMTPRRAAGAIVGLEAEAAGLARVGIVGAVPGAPGVASNRCFIVLMLYTLVGRSGALMVAERGRKQHVSGYVIVTFPVSTLAGRWPLSPV